MELTLRSVRAIVLLALKDMRLLLRDRLGAFFTFAFPVIYALLFGLMFSGSGEGSGTVSIVVVDADRSEGSRAFVDRIVGSDAIEVTLLEDRDQGEELVRRGKRAAMLVVPEGFGDPAATLVRGEQIRLEGVFDPSRRAESAILRGTLHGLIFQHIGEALADPERSSVIIADARQALADQTPSVIGSAIETMLSGVEGLVAEGGAAGLGENGGPVQLAMTEVAIGDRTVPVTAYALTFPQGAAWGLMACALGASLSLVGERSSGTLVRLTLAPIARWQILAGKAIACFVISMAMLTVLVGVAHLPIFGVRPESYAMLALAAVAASLAFVGVMMVIASFGKTVAAVEGFGRAMLLVLALVGGAAVPVIFMPNWMRTAAGISPFRWVIEAFDGAIWRGFGITDMLLPCGILLAIGLIGFGGGAAMFRFSRVVGGS